MPKTKFLLDANFLIIPVQFKVDIYSELRKFGDPDLYTLGLVLQELAKLKGGNVAFRMFIRNQGKVIEIGGAEHADDEIVKLVKDGYVACTLDKNLKERVRKAGGKVVFLRQKKYLEMG